MDVKMDLKYMISLCERELKRAKITDIENAIHQYLEECTEENISAIVGPVYHEVRKTYRRRKDVTKTYDDFWNEVARFYHYASCVYYEKRWGIKNARKEFPFLRDVMKEYAEKLLDSIYGKTFQARLIAQHEEMGGMHAVIEAMTKKMQKRTTELWISQLIHKHFGKYKNNYYAVHYIAAKCLTIYRPDLQESKYQEHFSCYYDIDKPSSSGLYAILTSHLREPGKHE